MLYMNLIDEVIGRDNFVKLEEFSKAYFKLLDLNNDQVKLNAATRDAKNKYDKQKKALMLLIFPTAFDFEMCDYWKKTFRRRESASRENELNYRKMYEKIYSNYKELSINSSREKLYNVNFTYVDDRNKINESLLSSYVLGNKFEIFGEIVDDFEIFLFDKELNGNETFESKYQRSDLLVRNSFIAYQLKILDLCKNCSEQEIDRVFDIVYENYELVKKSFNNNVGEEEITYHINKMSKVLDLKSSNQLLSQLKEYSLLSIKVINKEIGKTKKKNKI